MDRPSTWFWPPETVIFRKTGPEDPGCLNYVGICKDFVEADKGIWLPKLCYRVDYTTQVEPEHLRGKLTAVNKVSVSNLQVNNVPDSLFEVQFPPGTEIENGSKQVLLCPSRRGIA